MESVITSQTVHFRSLARQTSIYSLTLDEFQNAITEPGKNFGSMNMDEFLKNIWTAEESQAMAAAMDAIAEGSGSGGPADENSLGMLSRQPSLQRQGSITLPHTLSQKTVDEVWKDINRSATGTSGSAPPPGSGPQERQATFSGMTLEDFLVKAGVVREDMGIGSQGFGPIVEWLQSVAQQQQQQQWQQHQIMQQHVAEVAAAAAYADATGKQMGNGGGLIVGMSTMGMPGPMGAVMAPGMPGRKRGLDSRPTEKIVERRQRRMIKNRESAARSRARKQAYTVELEEEVSQLKEENKRLREQQEALRKAMTEFLKSMSKDPVVPKGKILRRTQTAMW
ncbi:unnamed protein product [Sphagnum jensenii]|uniref:BZIP domain-containing protein n=1 Tax=Sphagnum jensenii TaxID=128206 RepID=A0ABP0WB47_9BRYO